jgi:hypothetical protein
MVLLRARTQGRIRKSTVGHTFAVAGGVVTIGLGLAHSAQLAIGLLVVIVVVILTTVIIRV